MAQKEALDKNLTKINSDLLPTKLEERIWKKGHFFSIWMGSVHNVPSYVTIGGFFALGLSVWQVFFIILTASLLLAGILVLNGHVGAKYGIPFSVYLRASFGSKGAIFPGVLRGVIAAIMWFGLQTYAGSMAVTILIGKLWTGYLSLGGNWSFLGLNLSNLLSFLLFWMVNVFFIFAGINSLRRLNKIIFPLVFIVFGGMSVWAIKLAGGITPILNYSSKGLEGNLTLIFFSCISALLATWVAQIISVSDVTRYARSNKDQAIGQIAGLIVTYLLFAIASITIIIGSEIAFGVPIWNILEVVNRFDRKFVIIISLLTICLSTLSVNLVGNIFPSGYQLAALFPNKLSFKSGALLAAFIGVLIMPWKLMENSSSIFLFLNLVGGLLSPVAGVMLAHYYIVSKRVIIVEDLYSPNLTSKVVNLPALSAVIMAGFLSLIGNFWPVLKPLYDISWFTGIFSAALLYLFFNWVREWTINTRKYAPRSAKRG